MKRLKEQKGITLIALIITIIVLLILAVVAIGAVQNNGIIDHAKNAREEYGKAGVNENTTLQGYLDKIKDNLPTGTGTGNGNSDQNEDNNTSDNTGDDTGNTPGDNEGNTPGDDTGDVPVEEEEESVTAKYFTYDNWDSTNKTVTLTGIHSDYKPVITYNVPMYGEQTFKCPAYILDGETVIRNIVIPSRVKKDGVMYTVTTIATQNSTEGGFNCAKVNGMWLYILDEDSDEIVEGSYLSEIESIEIPDSVTSIEAGVFFNGCVRLNTVYYKGTRAQWDVISGSKYFENANIICSE